MPPKELTREQADEWRAVVGRLPADWFTRETHALLVAYCKHVSTHRLLSAEIDACDPAALATQDGFKRYERLLALRGRESRCLSALATRLRMTQQARYQPNTAHSAARRGGTGPKPWEFVP